MRYLFLSSTLCFSALQTNNCLAYSISKSIPFTRPKAITKLDTCTNFSGNWSGKCKTENNEEKSDSFLIDQLGCMYVDINNELFNFTGTKSAQDADSSSTVQSFMSVDWNENKTGFTTSMGVSGRSVTKANTLPYSGHSTSQFSMTETGIMKVLLQGFVVYRELDGSSKKIVFNEDCAYKKD